MTPTEKRQRFRAILNGPRCVSPATVFDALSARVAESVGYEVGILSGSVCAATMLAAPDLALHSLTEFSDQLRRITRASNLSVFVDADNGYGNALNVMRTVEELEHAGVSGVAIEDVIMPARFGSESATELVSVDEMAGKLRAAVAARRDPALLVVARSASLKSEKTASAVARAKAYAATGVDALFIVGMKKLEDLDAIRAEVRLPIIMGTMPGVKREELSARGVRFCLQGHPAVAASVKALRDTYAHLYAGGAPEDLKSKIATPEEMSRLLGEDNYRKWRANYLH
ncbi:MAG: isocitrate lyase/phosphoenolpyruvate mutase family protein [Betaproteobacteria bacterium]|nr:isocitrate lyase/phosphoenolpyruvate mutase family protein [Betaproteobacteria bacterium]